MKLGEKGSYAPRPVLPPHAEDLANVLGSWNSVRPRTHWLLGDEQQVDGADFYVDERELGHLHLDGTAHIPQAPMVANALLAAKIAQRFPWAQHWVVHPVVSEASARHAEWLFRLQFDHLQGGSSDLLVSRVRALTDIPVI